ncbi:MAG: VOC family protein [Proteobacteria bacterium]|nr:VOC family protein [Pseudomonadota bacterium]
MSDPIELEDCAPALVVSDIEASLAYYERALGFEVAFRYGTPTFYAGVCRGNVSIHLQCATQTERPPGASLVNVFVSSADAMYEELRTREARIRKAPATYPYGMRDFDVEDLDGNVLVFGSEAEPAS